jgi:foldase protein PrsA
MLILFFKGQIAIIITVKEENMKKKIIVLALCLLMISGCGRIPKLSNGDEAVVTLKDGSMISANELYNSMKEDYALETLVKMVDKQILEDKYKDKISDAEKDTETTMQELEAAYGDQLDAAIQYYTSYKSADEYKEYVYLSYLQELAINDYCKKQISDKDIEQYYKDNIVGDIKISHILITPAVTDSMTDEEKAKAEKEAETQINNIIKELKNTKGDKVQEKFEELAKEYSQDEATKEKGGSLGFINKDTLDSKYNELVNTAYSLKDGEYSTKLIKTELGYHVVLRTETKDKAPLDDVKDTIVDKLSEKYLEENPVANIRAMQELRKEYKVEFIDDEIKSKYAEYIQNAIANYEQQAKNN